MSLLCRICWLLWLLMLLVSWCILLGCVNGRFVLVVFWWLLFDLVGCWLLVGILL